MMFSPVPPSWIRWIACHWVALACLAGWIFCPRAFGFAVAGILLISPLLRAQGVAARLPGDLVQAFGPTSGRFGRPAPLRYGDLFRGVKIPRARIQTVTYKSAGQVPLQMDLYRASRPGPHPAVLVIHGGSWASGDRRQLPELNHDLAALGYLVAAIDYRLAPAAHFPAPVEDVAAAIAYMKGHASEIGFDGQRLILLGRSAGGQIALFSAYTLKDPVIQGAIGFYAPSDMVLAYAHPGNPLILNSRRVLRRYIGASDEESLRRSSPLAAAGPQAVPTLLIHGARDELVWVTHSEHLSQRLQELHRPVYFLRLPWATHGADAVFNGPSGQLSTYAVERFLAAVIPLER